MLKRGLAVAVGLAVASPAISDQITEFRLDALPPAEVVVLGEVHDNPVHHLNQARALRALQPTAVVFEMLTSAQAETVNAAEARDAALGEAIGWSESGWPDWNLYEPVFAALGQAQVYGAAVERERLLSAMREGAAAGFGPGAARFALDQPLPEAEQSRREAEQFSAHCDALPEEMLPGMVAAQRLRDAAFADTTLRALEAHGGPVAVITGSGHARNDQGIPAALQQAAPSVAVLSLGQVETTGPVDAHQPFDLWLTTPPVERPDPCAAFRPAGDG